MKRRSLIQSAGASVFGILGTSIPRLGRTQDRFAKYKGQTVRMSIPTHPHYDAMVKLLPEFTKQTGIKVETDRLPVPRMKEKQLLEMAKTQGEFDLICYVVMWKGEYVKKNLLSEIEPFFANVTLVDPVYDVKDIVPSYLENLGLVGGWKGYLAGGHAKLYGVPYGAETSILAYRKDIFAKHKLKPPESYYELEKLLPMLRDKEGIGALATRGQAGHQCVHAWLLHLNPLNGKVFENNWKPRFNDQAGVRALQFLKQVVDTGPAGSTGFGQGEMMTAFLQGQSAMYLDSTVIFGSVIDTARSKIDGKVGYIRHPKGSKYSSQTGGLGLAIPKNARNADAAFLLMQWLTSKEQDKAVCRLGGSPTRMSTLMDADLTRQYPEYITLRQQIKDADPDWRPIIAEWDEINTQALGVGIFDALTGKKTPKDALNSVMPKVTEIMVRGGYLQT
jgi:multiple sugar transport system substrate-binding protein